MITAAYCCLSNRESVRKAAGCEPMTIPPYRAHTLDAWRFEAADFLYIKLHGLPSARLWYGDNWQMAISEQQVRNLRLQGTVVFAACCYLAPDGQPAAGGRSGSAPMLDALLYAGARAVAGASGEIQASDQALAGADLVGFAFRLALQVGLPPRPALRLAQLVLRCSRYRDQVPQFKLYTQHSTTEETHANDHSPNSQS